MLLHIRSSVSEPFPVFLRRTILVVRQPPIVGHAGFLLLFHNPRPRSISGILHLGFPPHTDGGWESLSLSIPTGFPAPWHRRFVWPLLPWSSRQLHGTALWNLSAIGRLYRSPRQTGRGCERYVFRQRCHILHSDLRGSHGEAPRIPVFVRACPHSVCQQLCLVTRRCLFRRRGFLHPFLFGNGQNV